MGKLKGGRFRRPKAQRDVTKQATRKTRQAKPKGKPKKQLLSMKTISESDRGKLEELTSGSFVCGLSPMELDNSFEELDFSRLGFKRFDSDTESPTRPKKYSLRSADKMKTLELQDGKFVIVDAPTLE